MIAEVMVLLGLGAVGIFLAARGLLYDAEAACRAVPVNEYFYDEGEE
jgi:hypothetical protein